LEDIRRVENLQHDLPIFFASREGAAELRMVRE
jgi:hypothetical protein